jgi:polyhydroxybutyrate depolymerase
VVLYPNAVDKHWFDGRPSVADTNYDDVKFISTVMDSLVADGTVDSKRIYACGISNGGFFSQYLSIRLPKRIAAIASVAASVPKEFFSMPVQPVPILMILGTADPLVPFGGGKIGGTLLPGDRGEVVPAREAIDFWLERNKMSDRAVTSKLPSQSSDGGTSVFIERYGSPGSPNEVVFYEIKGGGHTWPGGMQYLAKRFIGPVCKDFSGNEVIWDFFKAHSVQAR